MKSIRVGFIGLSAKPSWAAEAHLPYLRDSPLYTIVALCNSSIDAAQAAITAHSLPASTRKYASPLELAADVDVDLVVCGTRVDLHYETIKPAVQAGKDCFVEWPLASNLAQATELRDIAKRNGCRVMVGLQNQTHPVVKKVKQFVDDKRIGRLVSCTVDLNSFTSGQTIPEPYAYLVDKRTGGNMFSILALHTIDALFYAVGEMTAASALFSVRYPTVDLLDQEGKVVRTIDRGVPDHVSFHGTLSSGPIITATCGGGSAPKGQPGITWHIKGDKAEILATSPMVFTLAEGYHMRIQDRDADGSEVVELGDETLGHLPYTARYVGALYDSFAKGPQAGYPDWDWAVKRHALLAALEESSTKGVRVSIPL